MQEGSFARLQTGQAELVMTQVFHLFFLWTVYPGKKEACNFVVAGTKERENCFSSAWSLLLQGYVPICQPLGPPS